MKLSWPATFKLAVSGATKSLVVLCLGLALCGLHVAPADASTASQIGSGKARRYCIDTAKPGCQSVGTWAAGSINMICWKDAPQSATGAYPSRRYFYATQGSRKGWVHSSWVTRQKTVPNCSTHKGVSKASWAAARIGEVNASPTVAAYLGWQSDPRWSGGCAGFGRASFRFGYGADPRFAGNAYPKFRSYQSVGKARAMVADPPVGSSLFWSAPSPHGHEAVYLGNGVVATTWGDLGDTYAVKRVTISGVGNGTPVGYVAPTDY